MIRSINIVIPVKDPSVAKSRLGGFLEPDERAALATSLFERTIRFFTSHFPELHVLVVTDSKAIGSRALALGVRVLDEEQTSGVCGAAERAASWGLEHGYRSQLLIPADIARLEVGELRFLLSQPRPTPSAIICRAIDGGTNALLTTPPDAIPFRFGYCSSNAHRTAAAALGVSYRLLCLPHISVDIDSPRDLRALVPKPYNSVAGEALYE